MDHASKRRQILYYFRHGLPKRSLLAAALGLVVVLVGAETPAALAAGTLLLVLGGASAYHLHTRSPGDDPVDAWIEQDVEDLLPRARDQGDLDVSEEIRSPVSLWGPRLRNRHGARLYVRRSRQDGRTRFSVLDVGILFFTARSLTAYRCALDLTTGNPLGEEVSTYFYRDVVAVETKARSQSIPTDGLPPVMVRSMEQKGAVEGGMVQLQHSQEFVLSTSGGTFFAVSLDAPELYSSSASQLPADNLAREAVRSVRAVLRDKRI